MNSESLWGIARAPDPNCEEIWGTSAPARTESEPTSFKSYQIQHFGRTKLARSPSPLTDIPKDSPLQDLTTPYPQPEFPK